ncbi:hypothetical protein G6F57_018716 [Rhizopus arrhizus]|nr:hypothetical protein G6F57_018716 [Rhizopus arrhizus]
MDVEEHGLPIGQDDARLDMAGVVRHGPYRRGAGVAQCCLDGLRDAAGRIQFKRLVCVAVAQLVFAVAAGQARQPGRAFGSGQAVQDVHGDGDIAFQVAQHHGFGGAVAFVEQRRERQAVRQQQADEEDQEQARDQRARPREAARGGGSHWSGSETSTAAENT